MKKVATLIQKFFIERLTQQLHASSNTIASYRDTFKLLLSFINKKNKKNPSILLLEDLDAQCIGEFLRYLETERKNSVRTRNVRLAAIHSFFSYILYLEPQYGAQIQRILSIPQKKSEKRMVDFLTTEEIKAILAEPNKSIWVGRRDYALLLVAAQTGLRVSELIGLKINQIKFGIGAHIRCYGKGRKERCTPLTRQIETILKEWLRENIHPQSKILFPSIRGGELSRDAVEKLVKKYTSLASTSCPSLKEKNVTPHVFRHTTAVHLLQAGVDTSLIALYLGHESPATTQIYLKADLTLKEKALAKITPMSTTFRRYKPDDKLMEFLNDL